MVAGLKIGNWQLKIYIYLAQRERGLSAALTSFGLVDNRQQSTTVKRMSRPRHTDKHIEQVVAYAESLGWIWKPSDGHPWGRLFCPFANREGCILSVWSTPKNPQNFARLLRRRIDSCPHKDIE